MDAEELALELELTGFSLELDSLAVLELECTLVLELETTEILELEIVAILELDALAVPELDVIVVLELDESLPLGLVLLSLQAEKRAKEIGRRIRIVFIFSNIYKLVYKDWSLLEF